ncbi:metal ABC transporter ATP-binding protein [Corynebacterium uropygiale]|uniref:metal ABC transporter ATP-binding protein n=1 Tax=Corynebacterium uropygiale TaxID=1775911 RepID=UPI0030843BDD
MTQDSTSTALSVRGLTVSYGGPAIVKDASLTVPRGAVMGLLGPNGAGKSTFLNAILGLVPRARGEVTFFGDPLRAARRRIAHMPQTARVDLDYPITVEGVVRMGTYPRLGLFRRPGERERALVDDAISRMGLDDHRHHQISELSGGQLKRTFLARVLAQDPELYLLDEPFAGVDVVSDRVIRRELQRLAESGATVVLIHHDLATVKEICSHVTLLDHRVIASGTLKEAFTPENINAAYGLGLMTEDTP